MSEYLVSAISIQLVCSHVAAAVGTHKESRDSVGAGADALRGNVLTYVENLVLAITGFPQGIDTPT
jgi:hypothetical protein